MTAGTISVSSPGYSFEKTWSGADDPLNKKAINAYSMSVSSHKRTQSKLLPYPSYPPQYWCDCSSSFPLTWSSNDELALLGKIAAKAKQHQFNLAVAVGEGKSTVNMVLGTLKTLGSVALSLKKGDFGKAIAALPKTPQGSLKTAKKRFSADDLAGTWLALSYGWMPFVNDVYEAAKAYEVLTAPPIKSRVSASHYIASFGDSSASQGGYSCPAVKRRSERISFLIVENLSTARSLGLIDPKPLVWELLPLSFVADWFIPIGKYLEVLSVLNGLQVSSGYRNSRQSQSPSGGVTIKNVGMYDPEGFSSTYKSFAFSRTPTGLPSVPMPSFRGLSNKRQLASSAALIYQRIDGLRDFLLKLR